MMGAALGIYWLVLFVFTHLPPELLTSSANRMMADGGDKTLHCVAYAGLSFLFAGWMWMRDRVDRSLIGVTLLVTGLYAIVDELLQIPVRRTADVMDVFADWCGILIGLGCFLLVKMTWSQWGRRVASS